MQEGQVSPQVVIGASRLSQAALPGREWVVQNPGGFRHHGCLIDSAVVRSR